MEPCQYEELFSGTFISSLAAYFALQEDKTLIRLTKKRKFDWRQALPPELELKGVVVLCAIWISN